MANFYDGKDFLWKLRNFEVLFETSQNDSSYNQVFGCRKNKKHSNITKRGHCFKSGNNSSIKLK